MKIQRLTVTSAYGVQPHDDGELCHYSDVQPFLEPRPISEAPEQARRVLGLYGDSGKWIKFVPLYFTQGVWWDDAGFQAPEPTHWMPLPPVGEQGCDHCQSCNDEPAREPHVCPFADAVNMDDRPCNCCNNCTSDCGDRI